MLKVRAPFFRIFILLAKKEEGSVTITFTCLTFTLFMLISHIPRKRGHERKKHFFVFKYQ